MRSHGPYPSVLRTRRSSSCLGRLARDHHPGESTPARDRRPDPTEFGTPVPIGQQPLDTWSSASRRGVGEPRFARWRVIAAVLGRTCLARSAGLWIGPCKGDTTGGLSRAPRRPRRPGAWCAWPRCACCHGSESPRRRDLAAERLSARFCPARNEQSDVIGARSSTGQSLASNDRCSFRSQRHSSSRSLWRYSIIVRPGLGSSNGSLTGSQPSRS